MPGVDPSSQGGFNAMRSNRSPSTGSNRSPGRTDDRSASAGVIEFARAHATATSSVSVATTSEAPARDRGERTDAEPVPRSITRCPVGLGRSMASSKHVAGQEQGGVQHARQDHHRQARTMRARHDLPRAAARGASVLGTRRARRAAGIDQEPSSIAPSQVQDPVVRDQGAEPRRARAPLDGPASARSRPVALHRHGESAGWEGHADAATSATSANQVLPPARPAPRTGTTRLSWPPPSMRAVAPDRQRRTAIRVSPWSACQASSHGHSGPIATKTTRPLGLQDGCQDRGAADRSRNAVDDPEVGRRPRRMGPRARRPSRGRPIVAMSSGQRDQVVRTPSDDPSRGLASMAMEPSVATTATPRRARWTASTPVPHPSSSTRSPGSNARSIQPMRRPEPSSQVGVREGPVVVRCGRVERGGASGGHPAGTGAACSTSRAVSRIPTRPSRALSHACPRRAQVAAARGSLAMERDVVDHPARRVGW